MISVTQTAALSQQDPEDIIRSRQPTPSSPPPHYKSLVDQFLLDGPPTYKVVIGGERNTTNNDKVCNLFKSVRDSFFIYSF